MEQNTSKKVDLVWLDKRTKLTILPVSQKS
jgi:hypothetical protein